MRQIKDYLLHRLPWRRCFSCSARRFEIRDTSELRDSIIPIYTKATSNELLSLQWPSAPQNILLVRKDGVDAVSDSLIEFTRHIHSNYPVNILLEPATAKAVHNQLSVPVYTTSSNSSPSLATKTDLVTTLGGDGTILRASSLFSQLQSVPPILSFSLGTLGFLSEWHFTEHKRAFREVYMSGSTSRRPHPLHPISTSPAYPEHSTIAEDVLHKSKPSGWSSVRGMSLGAQRAARILLRNRLQVSLYDTKGAAVFKKPTYALNEVLLHRGAAPHLTHIDISVGGRHLTSAVADGMIISTPTGSTAYSLSSGGSIIHPLVSSLLITPICPRSLSFRPLVLPSNTPVTLRLSSENRGTEVEMSIDGQRREGGLSVGMEVKLEGEEMVRGEEGWTGGVPCVMRSGGGQDANGDDAWLGGLNGLLKFNYPFGNET